MVWTVVKLFIPCNWVDFYDIVLTGYFHDIVLTDFSEMVLTMFLQRISDILLGFFGFFVWNGINNVFLWNDINIVLLWHDINNVFLWHGINNTLLWHGINNVLRACWAYFGFFLSFLYWACFKLINGRDVIYRNFNTHLLDSKWFLGVFLKSIPYRVFL